ncbi:flagellar biosynthetic protein FliO [Paenibacillus sp. MSJ-34]|uniref:flagellar biosynthetic protein FliO n=2 Tax=unclassified Paenibacillus TaxID=185978 RepID=UPI001C1015A0|nr:flagellar biosynthetic protein FliO [Paenibacillus sp. MSJ-34]MBU5441776.1 flagellar biosynthetic protein FliO [Paenibacillus sp. MSJ-34]CAH0119821.1 hypothetical protein PAE9249_02329 [Paenibacillus sp. CECT 9249]
MISLLSVEPEIPGRSYDPMSAVLNVVWVIVAMIIVIALIVVVAKFLGQKNRTWLKNRSIRTLGAIGLAQNKSLQVLEIGNTIYVIGVGDDVRLVDKVSDPDEVAAIVAAFESELANRTEFGPLINGIRSKFRKREAKTEQYDQEQEMSSVSFHEVFQTKLNRMPNRKQKVEELLQDENNADRLMDK